MWDWVVDEVLGRCGPNAFLSLSFLGWGPTPATHKSYAPQGGCQGPEVEPGPEYSGPRAWRMSTSGFTDGGSWARLKMEEAQRRVTPP